MSALRISTNGDVSSLDLAMMDRAIQLARDAAAIGEVPVGAVVYRGEQIIAEGCQTTTFTRDCDDLQAIIIGDADLQLPLGLGPDASTDVLHDGDR